MLFSNLLGTMHFNGHIVPCGKFHRIGGAPPQRFPNVKYDAPEEVGGDKLDRVGPVDNRPSPD